MIKGELTPAEQFELEILLNNRWENFEFTPMLLDPKTNEVLINDLEFEDLVRLFFLDQYSINDKTIAVNYNLFKILQFRYFRNNQTVQFIGLNNIKKTWQKTD